MKKAKKKAYSDISQYLSSPSITNSEESDDEWSVSFLKTLNHKKGQNVYSKMTNTIWWGWFLIIFTWFLFVTGMSGVFGIWQWVFRIENIRNQEKSYDFPIIDYYFLLIVLTGGVVAWIWVGINWLGLKYFRMTETKGDP
ncbi:hypothetical protein T552_02681 [Pneumocystis carinii B80]|uniref:Uncharacterized protein n=1 Tax=Pneumocystis carinii (strain B80) TaxID=1408658 RepID=A0A0W4ZE65_PNEC8|nr:hypothetical protein T552_02681 [Pneumocystis carinii B80]KTW26672.1 hypothetical protein T552_02681 [Pneumocystis carinii B80]